VDWRIHAAGTVTVCNETNFDAALSGGGTVTFTCDGTITITATKNISVDTILDVTGHTVAISGNNAVRLFTVNPVVNFAVYNLTLANGRSTNGGAIYNSGTLVLSNSTFSGNSVSNSASGLGGAIYNNLGTVTAISSSFSSNNCRGGDGANGVGPAPVGNGLPGNAGAGGAIYNNAGNLNVTNCTFVGNTATGGRGGNGGDGFLSFSAGNGGAGGSASGGGISSAAGILTIVNSTFLSNNCTGGNGGNPGTGGAGGGVRGNGGDGSGGAVNHNGVTAVLINATFFGNGCTGGTGNTNGNRLGGNIRNNSTGSLTLKNTIVAYSSSGTNASGTITDGGNNISTDLSCNFTNIGSTNNTDPRLGPLADNGGPTLTKALLQNSPAIDAGNDAVSLPTDQRGVARYGISDIGAFEMTPPTILSALYLPNGHLRLQCSGVIGPSYFIQASTNLANWVELTNLTSVTNRIFEFEDNNAPSFSIRFYRLQAH
jgi:hypothetical protein